MQRGEKVKEGGEREREGKKDGVRKGDPVLSFILFFFRSFFLVGSCLSVLSVCGCMCVCVRVCFLLSFSSSFQSLHSFFSSFSLLFFVFFYSLSFSFLWRIKHALGPDKGVLYRL